MGKYGFMVLEITVGLHSIFCNRYHCRSQGFVDDDVKKSGINVDGLPVKILEDIEPSSYIVLAIGDGRVRSGVFDQVQTHSMNVLGFTHSSSWISNHASLDKTAMVCARASIQTGVSVSRSALINTGSIVEHDCRVGAFAHIAPGATVCGNVEIGERAWVGAGATVREGVKIGCDVMLGAGSVVVSDIPSGATAYGVPAKVVSK